MNTSKTKSKPKNRKPALKNKTSQHQLFVEKAKALGSDESGETFERAFKKVMRLKKS